MSAPSRDGTPFGRYLLLRKIAVGGMAEIWLARPLDGSGKPVVLKRILPQFASDPEFVSRFREEASLTLSLVHGNVVPVFEVGAVGDEPYIAMEHVPGHDLRSILRTAREAGIKAPPAVAAYVAAELLRGLDYAHRKSDSRGKPLELVHRDVSPSNVVVSNEGTVKLLDFGIAKAIGRAEATRTGVLRGKVGYMSPEQARGEQIGPQSDLFSTGVVLWELLTAERLFDGDSEPMVLEKVKRAEAPSAASRNPRVPSALDDILRRALARDVADRYPSASAFHSDLSRFLHGPDGAGGTAEATAGFVRKLFPSDSPANEPELDDYTATHAGGRAQAIGPALVLGGATPAPPRPRAWPRVAALAVAVIGVASVAGLGIGKVLGGSPSPAPAGSAEKIYVATKNVLGAEIWIDGRFTGIVTPNSVPVGPGGAGGGHVLALRHADYLPWEERIPAGATVMDATLLPDYRTLSVTSDPPGAKVSIDVAGSEPCNAPCSFQHLLPSMTVQLSGELPGYRRAAISARVADSPTVKIALERSGAAVAIATTPAAAATPGPISAGTGSISFRVKPWAYLSIDGGKETERPLYEQSVGAGGHTLHIRRDDDPKVDLSCPFAVAAGQSVKLRELDLDRGPAACPSPE